jgi:Tfp pilus assembly protein PilV
MPAFSRSESRGTSLLEAVIAAGLLATILTSVLPLVTVAVAGTAVARTDLMASHLARQRLAQLQALTHLRTAAGVIADDQSRLDQADLFTAGGQGLIASGPTPLTTSTSSWVDWLDERGAWQSAGTQPPPGARYRRRWGILAAGADGCLRVWVEVTPLGSSVGGHTAHEGSLQCPWGVAAS